MATIFGDDTDNSLTGTTGRDLIYGRGGEDTLDGGEGNDVLYGGDGNDTLYGGEGDDQLTGGEGADYMEGGNGNDTYYVDNVDDIVVEIAGAGIDHVVSTISYILGENLENLTLSGTADIFGRGNDLNNTLKGNAGNNNLYGAGGNDSINGGLGNDIIGGGEGNDFLIGGDGIDLLTYKVGSTGGVTVSLAITTKQNTGGGGMDTVREFENLEGTIWDDNLTGNSGDNKIAGLAGNDVIRGGGGNDDITAGADADTVVFEAAGANGFDRIRGFVSGTDKLEFHVADGYSATAGFTVGTAAVGSDAQFVYDDVLDHLYYDADGDGAGAAVGLASLANLAVKLVASDIAIV
jgi:Ca2+-binding RTX toxin-like protein